MTLAARMTAFEIAVAIAVMSFSDRSASSRQISSSIRTADCRGLGVMSSGLAGKLAASGGCGLDSPAARKASSWDWRIRTRRRPTRTCPSSPRSIMLRIVC